MKVKNPFYTGKVYPNQYRPKTSNKHEVINSIAKSHLVEWYVTYYRFSPLSKVEDIVQDIYVMLFDVPQEKYDDLWMQGEYSAIVSYVCGLLKNQCRSHTSYVAKKYYGYEDRQEAKEDEFWNTVSEVY